MAVLPEKYFSVDVECVATGRRHDERSVALVAVVDKDENVLLKAKVKQDNPVFSYLTPLTGLREGDLDDGEQLDDVIRKVKALFGPDVVLVGQVIQSDITWLKLEEKRDFESSVDLSELFKTDNPHYGDYNYYSLSHEANTLIQSGMITEQHDPVVDAIASIQLFKRYYNNPALLDEAKQKLLNSHPPTSWMKMNKYRYEGVCLAGHYPRNCSCVAPTLRKT